MIDTSDILAKLAEFIGEAQMVDSDGEHPLVSQRRGGDSNGSGNLVVTILLFIIGT